MSNFIIRPAQPHEEQQIFEELIRPHIRYPDRYEFSLASVSDGFYPYVVLDSSELVSVSILERVVAENFVEESSFFDLSIEEYAPIQSSDTVGFLKTGYTKPEYTGEGAGTALLQVLESIAILNGIDYLVVEAWVHGGDDSPDKALSNEGFTAVVSATPGDNMLKYDQLQADLCTKCEGNCSCSTTLFVKEL